MNEPHNHDEDDSHLSPVVKASLAALGKRSIQALRQDYEKKVTIVKQPKLAITETKETRM